MFPEPLFHIFGQGISPYGLSFAFGFLLCLPLVLYLAKERGLPAMMVVDGWFIAVVSFSLAFSVGLQGLLILKNKTGLLLGPEVFMIIVVLGVIWPYAVRQASTSFKFPEILDILFPALAFLQTFARLGCFSAGCCHGRPAYNLPWAVTFNHSASACLYQGIPVHPTQLYLAVGSFFLLVLLTALWKRSTFRGQLIWVYLFLFGLLRFTFEFYRGDTNVGIVFMGLSFTQLLCLLSILIGATMLGRRLNKVGRGWRRTVWKAV